MISNLFLDLWGIIRHPTVTSAHIAAHPPFGTAVCLLCLVSLLWVMELVVVRERARHPRQSLSKGQIAAMLVLIPLCVAAIWFWMTLLMLGMLRIVGRSPSFESVFCLLAFVGSFLVIPLALEPLQNWRRVGYQLFRVSMLGVMVWIAILICLGLHGSFQLSWGQTLFVALPPVGLLCAGGIDVWRSPADSLVSVYPWRCAKGRHTVVFHPAGKDAQEIAEIVQGCDRTLEQIMALFRVERLPFQVYVFLFLDQEARHKLLKLDGKLSEGNAHGDSISLAYGAWNGIRGTVAHELCHVVREQRIAAHLPALLDEGLAVYIERRLNPNSTWKPAVTMPTPLRALAYNAVFYGWDYATDPEETSWKYYSHACSFVQYLIGPVETEGMGKFLRFCRETGNDAEKDAGERLASAALKVYGISLTQIEREWRNDSATCAVRSLFDRSGVPQEPPS